jgi:hypothetical protein
MWGAVPRIHHVPYSKLGMLGRICNGLLRTPRQQADSGLANEAATTMTPQQRWYSLPVPYAHRPGHEGRRRLALTAGAVAAGALIVAVLVGRAATGAAPADPDDLGAPRSATADGEAAFLEAYEAGGFLDVGSRDAVLRVGRASCTDRGESGADTSTTLSPPDAQRVAELARLHLCEPGRTG